MLLLLTRTAPEIVRLRERHGAQIGRLVTPRQFSSVEATAHAGIPWAVDNDAFKRWNADAFAALIERVWGLPGCLFIAAPDVVGDAAATLARFEQWYDQLNRTLQPLALVAQDGLTSSMVPWARIDALFVGGSTSWKLSADAARLVREARTRDLRAHVGRVNSVRRARYARSIGATSIDGTKFARFPDTYAHLIRRLIEDPFQPMLEETPS